jgi:hypothetical protein
VITAVSERDGRHDFDFLYGSWHIRNERLVDRLQGSAAWETFDAVGVIRPILGGTGNLDEYATSHWPGFEGLSLRVFDPATRLWSIYWADNASGAVKPPTVGRFEGARGDFHGDEVIDGRDIKVHFVWADVDTAHPTWTQAFSADGGQTWEINWRMKLTRIDRDAETKREGSIPRSLLLAPRSTPVGAA